MKYFFDNNLPISLARAIAALCQPEELHIEHIKDRFPEDAKDVECISKLAEEGNWAVITQDRLRKGSLEKEALRASGLVAFMLVRTWANHVYWAKAAQLVRWWPRIIEQADLVSGGAAFEVPWNVRGKGQFRQVRL